MFKEIYQLIRTNLAHLLRYGEDAANEQEVIEGIERGVEFRGAKLWILVIAIFVASLGLNTNSAAVIIGAMLISPLMGPIIGLGLSAAIYDFDLLKRSWRNYIVATMFSVVTATLYFLITPIATAQSELMARTSPTIYDVLIALCGGLAGIIALSSKSQRTGNVIPGVAIATALMPPLCTVGFGLATANWTYAAGALYLFLINTVFIALATFVGAAFIMRFEKKSFVNQNREKQVKQTIYALVLVAVLPAIILTYGMVREGYFEQRVVRFIQQELNFDQTTVVSHHSDYDTRSFSVVLIGEEIDSMTIQTVRERLPFYKLEGSKMQIIQGTNKTDSEEFNNLLMANNQELHNFEALIAQQKLYLAELERQIQPYNELASLTPRLYREMRVLFPSVEEISLAQGSYALADSTGVRVMAIARINKSLNTEEQNRLFAWLCERIGRSDVKILYEN